MIFRTPVSSLIILAVLFLQFCAERAAAQKRVALVIGNAAYKLGGTLANPINDAKLIATALKAARFETIEAKSNLGIAEFRQALRRFQGLADGAEVALIYFAGHGVEANGINWLIPTDAELSTTRDLEYEAIKLDLALQALGGAQLRIIILDACRNNPFGRSWQAASRAVARGLNRQDADNVLVLFAAAPGQLASDGQGQNSPFASALANRLSEEGLAIQLLGGRVRDDVISSTGDSQRPYVSASITGEPFYLVPSKAAKSTAAAHQLELMFWSSVKDSTSASVLRTYVERYPNGEFTTIARALIDHYEQQAKLSLAAREEDERRQERAKKDAELKRLEIEQRTRELVLSEERLRAARAKNAQEVKRIEDQERAEHAARAEELRKAREEAREAKEAARIAEEQRLAAVKLSKAATKAAEASIAAKRKSGPAGDQSKISALPKIEKPVPEVKKRPDALTYSRGIWTSGSVRNGQTVSTTTPHGTLTCVGGSSTSGRSRECRWH